MTLVTVNFYLCANILLALVTAMLLGIRASGASLRRPIAFSHQLQCSYALTVAALLLPGVALNLGHRSFLPSAAQVWSSPTMHEWTRQTQDQSTMLAFTNSNVAVSLDSLGGIAIGLFVTGLLLLIIRVAIDARALLGILKHAQTIKHIGCLKLLASDQIAVPFSFWWPPCSFIVVPNALLLHPNDLRIAISHEGQHHRQRDTRLLYLYQLLKALFFWNPAVHLLARNILQLQELACDEALAMQRKVSAQDYARCLLRVASGAEIPRRTLLSVSMIGQGTDPRTGSLLRKRIAIMLARPTRNLGKSAVVIGACTAFAMMIATTVTFATTIHDRRISTELANHMATVARQNSVIPIAVNDRVVEQLNRYLGTPDGRAFIRGSIARMRLHESLISASVAQHGLPQELLAVPLVESGYRNLPPSNTVGHGAGLWMFIKPTARHFGLNVTTRDERLDIAAETDAAMRYFSALYTQLHDWHLTLLAYNTGSTQVETAIRVTDTRNAWELIAQGFENDPDYLPRVMAVILILKNPQALD